MTLKELLDRFTYKPGWKFYLSEDTLDIEALAVDTDNFSRIIPVNFAVKLPPPFAELDWMDWLLHQIMIIEDHEAREFFKVDGMKVFDPHG